MELGKAEGDAPGTPVYVGRMTAAELRIKWLARHNEWRKFGAIVNGELIANEVLADLESLAIDHAIAPLTLSEASAMGGYSVDHLQRLVANGQIANVGRRNRPRIRQCDVPIKSGHVLQDSPSRVVSDRRRIVASVTTGGNEEQS